MFRLLWGAGLWDDRADLLMFGPLWGWLGGVPGLMFRLLWGWPGGVLVFMGTGSSGGILVLVHHLIGGQPGGALARGWVGGWVGGWESTHKERLSPHALRLPVPSFAKVYTVRIEAGGYSTRFRLTSAFACEGVRCMY